ncbi:hypothetical protein KXR87_12870 [Yokenella regensburgei]|uniref:hypothetical protein n=1 Tax=Yokenella regensburgei TaxID=158877 RepID=UPI003F16A6C1
MKRLIVSASKAVAFISCAYALGASNEYLFPSEGLQVTFGLTAILIVIAWSEIKDLIRSKK